MFMCIILFCILQLKFYTVDVDKVIFRIQDANRYRFKVMNIETSKRGERRDGCSLYVE